MLDRIQTGVEQQQAFVSNASHELRTPLAIMRAEIDVSLASGDLSEDARQVLKAPGRRPIGCARSWRIC